jgi:hypothetical protein
MDHEPNPNQLELQLQDLLGVGSGIAKGIEKPPELLGENLG